jgi:hypothetical protein
LHGIAGFFRSHQLRRDLDAADHDNAFLCFQLAGYLRTELAITRIDVTRFQRSSKSAENFA